MQRPRHGKRQLMTVATIVAGLLGGNWISRWFDHRPPAQAPVLPGLRRSAKAILQLEIVMPDGSTWSPTLRASIKASTLGSLDIRQRRLDFKLSAAADTTLRADVYATAVGKFAGFSASAEEGRPAIWRLAVPEGLATIRARLRREYADC